MAELNAETLAAAEEATELAAIPHTIELANDGQQRIDYAQHLLSTVRQREVEAETRSTEDILHQWDAENGA